MKPKKSNMIKKTKRKAKEFLWKGYDRRNNSKSISVDIKVHDTV